MEIQGWGIEELDFEPKCMISIERERKILDYYSRADSEKHRKSRAELFVKQYIQGLLSVLGVNLDKLQFIQQQSLCTELTMFLQNCKRIQKTIGGFVDIKEGEFIILMEGCIAKKQDSHLSVNQSICSQFMKRKPRNSSNQLKINKTNLTVVSNFKKLFSKRFQSNQNLYPKVLYYDSSDRKSFECRTDVVYLQFAQLSLQKLQNWIENKQKQCLINFIATCFGVEDRKSFVKLVTKINKHRIYKKSQFAVQPNIIYLIYQGEISIKTNQYQISLNKNSIIYKSQKKQFQAFPGDCQTILISLQTSTLVEQLNESFNDTLIQVMNKLNSLHEERASHFNKLQPKAEQQYLIQPIFNTDILKIKIFERSKFQEFKQNAKDYRKFSIPRSIIRPQSTRFRVGQSVEYDQNQIEPELSIFLSNYPYMKIVQSQIKINKISKQNSPYNHAKRTTSQKKQITQQQKKKAERERKKMYYMNKVRKLKIRNMAQKQIPNGHKKKFKVDQAEKEISDYSLFTNIIQYPTNGISDDAVKQSRNKNLIRTMIKLSSINSKLERKTIGYNQELNKTLQGSKEKLSNQYFGIDTWNNDMSDQIQQKDESAKQRKTTINFKEEDMQKDLRNCSFYFTRTLNPHLPTQKQIKQKKIQNSHHIRHKKNKQNYKTRPQFTQYTTKSIQSDQNVQQNLTKPTCIDIKIPKEMSFKANCQRIKAIL